MIALSPALRYGRVIGILRNVPFAQAIRAIVGLESEGLRCVAPTIGSPDAERTLREAYLWLPQMAFGAGTVMRGSELTRAGDARAGFILSPHVDDDLITHSTPLGTPLLAGASTATECVREVTAGAAGVKLFPASTGGRGYLAALRQPLGSRSFAPTGGITLETASAFIDAGAPAVTLGGTLTTLDGRDLTEAAQRVVAAAKVAQPLAGCGD